MTAITFLASSKPFILPEEIENYNNQTVFEKEEDYTFFYVRSLDPGWQKEIDGLFSMPYLYEVEKIDSPLFLTYLEKYMETGDVLEIYSVPNQHALEKYIEGLHRNSEPIRVNTGSHTYEDTTGRYQLDPKKWTVELSHKNFVTHRGVTTFVKY
ncbi:hypothetical protein [Planococcus sp. CAU13]|uniref:hypothetical protein n=1 Tax=Planococcus sp. CAU13 TaxID=1541197 RepID=UPI00052FF7F1|nr:hypothetical protein [Planococcus sp. CAU13]